MINFLAICSNILIMKESERNTYPRADGIEVAFLTEEEARMLAGQLSEIEDSWFLSGYQHPDSALLRELQT